MKLKKYLQENLADTKNFTSNSEILRAAMQAKLDTINYYEQLAMKTTNRNVRKVLLDVAREEKVHIGEFEELLEMIDPDYEPAEEEGEEELEMMGIKKE